MANVKISDLPAAASAGGTDQLETNQGGTSRRLTVAQVATHVRSTATDTVVVAAGSASAPSISPTGDSNTGIFFPAADTIAFSEGGVEALRLDSSGNATFAGTAAMSSSFLRNRIINGDMRIDQRNAGASVSINNSSAYTMDRWFVDEQTDGVCSVQRSTVAPAGFTNSLLFTTTTADASLGAGQYAYLGQAIEGFNIADFGWGTASAQTVTLSFWVRSSLTGTFGGSLRNGAANRAYPFTYTINSANTFEYKTITIAGDTSGTWATDNAAGLWVFFGLGVGSTFSGTAGAWAGSNFLSATGGVSVIGTLNATFYLTGVQLEVGTAATPFERRLYGQEFLLCQRYLEVLDYSINTTRVAIVYATGQPAQLYQQFSVTKRATPTISWTVNGAARYISPSIISNNITLTSYSTSLSGTTVSSGATGLPASVGWIDIDGGSTMRVSAEL